MYCPDCQQHWTLVEGKRAFKFITADQDVAPNGLDLSGIEYECPTCRECESDVEARKFVQNSSQQVTRQEVDRTGVMAHAGLLETGFIYF